MTAPDPTPESPDVAAIRDHLRHMTDGYWHDNCSYCAKRRRYGGDGVNTHALLDALDAYRRDLGIVQDTATLAQERADRAEQALRLIADSAGQCAEWARDEQRGRQVAQFETLRDQARVALAGPP